MWEKMKACYNKKYALVCGYIIITAVIIFALAFATLNIKDIYSWINGFVKSILHLLKPIILGVIIAYLFEPLAMFFERQYKKIPFIKFKNIRTYRSLGTFTCLITVTLFIAAFVTLFVYSLTKQISGSGLDEVIVLVVGYINSFTESLGDVQETLAKFNIESNAIKDIIQQISTSLITLLQNFTDTLVNSTMTISGHLTNAMFGIIIAIYLILDKESFISYGNCFYKAMVSPKTELRIKSYWKDFDTIFSGYIRGQIADVIFMCIVLSLTLSVIGIKFSVLIGIFAGICNMIPYFGPVVAYAGTIAFGLLNGQFKQVIIAVIALIIIQQIDGSIVGPRLMGQNVSLKPVFVLIAVIIGGASAGLLGMVLAVPVAGLIKLILKRYIDNRLIEKELLLEKDIETNPDVSD